MADKLHILLTGGGTGGHLFPGLAVAAELRECATSVRITFAGTGKDWERTEVERAGYDYVSIAAAPLLASPLGLVRAIYSNGKGYRAARRTLRGRWPDVVVGLGGYSSVPIGLAAAREGMPLLLLEQNAVPGRANRLLSRWATTVCSTFETGDPYFSPKAKFVRTGNPVRREIVDAATIKDRESSAARDDAPTLVVLGGSQGAHSLNLCVVESLPKLAPAFAGWQIIHQTGTRDGDLVRAAYAEVAVSATVQPFFRDMADVLSRATLAVARAGATTLAELAVMGIPAVLLPYPHAAANHQWHNAQSFGRAGAAVVVEDRPEPGRSSANLVASLLPLLRIPELRREMRLAMLGSARPDAAAKVALELLALAARAKLTRQSA